MENFTPWSALAGGVVIGLAASLLLWANGRVAGISGIFGGMLRLPRGDNAWRWWFVAGLLAAGLAAGALVPGSMGAPVVGTPVLLAVAGLLVGFGTRLSGGCTSGHGICGNSRLSKRSLAATGTFMLAGGFTVWLVGRVGGLS